MITNKVPSDPETIVRKEACQFITMARDNSIQMNLLFPFCKGIIDHRSHLEYNHRELRHLNVCKEKVTKIHMMEFIKTFLVKKQKKRKNLPF